MAPTEKNYFCEFASTLFLGSGTHFHSANCSQHGCRKQLSIQGHLDTLLGYGEDAKESRLTSGLYYADSGNFDETDPVAGSNIGLAQRWTYSKGSALVEMESNLHHDLCSQRCLILNAVGIGFKFWQSKDAFRLMGGDKAKNYRVSLLDVHLKVARVTLAPTGSCCPQSNLGHYNG